MVVLETDGVESREIPEEKEKFLIVIDPKTRTRKKKECKV